MSTLRAQKSALRASMRATLRALPAASILSQSQRIAALVLESPQFQQSKSVSCFMSMQGEVDTTSIVEGVLKAGKQLFVPRVDEGTMHMLRVYDEDDLSTLIPGLWGIREPEWEWKGNKRETAVDGSIDFVVMPGMAFDRSFHRIGYGKGYYDRFLASFPVRPKTVALSLNEQLLAAGSVPVGKYDQPVDAIATPEGFVQPISESQTGRT
ncbi:hypothetical protein BOTBODRAFT_30625 [Botryobasidium botryosum FD-172 SS1]|uniref:5-formyltetrahydrofolate cyclo-ligase n=1 Tax=Botryobasidium botryosum (strain FD-172 SS1) TaxID=930990 RepID=A0A067MLS6_BOTB1|nr:hypothetical protein BOTBODRAFT_30625 [Botryobasidium botryosum FD-172 SS1]